MPTSEERFEVTLPAPDGNHPARAGRAVPPDYDEDPGRFAASQLATTRFVRTGDVHPIVADRIAAERCDLVLDLGGANGVLARLLSERGVHTVVVDYAAHVAQAPRPAVRADALRLPFPNDTFDGAAALWMLYHLEDVEHALAELRRVLRPGALLAACTASRTNDPELSAVLPGWGQPTTFDAEEAPSILANVFGDVEVLSWDGPLAHLPDRMALTIFLRGRGLSESDAERAAEGLRVPLDVTKRGILVYARKPPERP